VAVVNGTSGLVERINLRTIVLRSVDGTVHVFPNGAITSFANMTRDFSYYVFDISVAYKEDTDRVITVLQGIAQELSEEEPYKSVILEPLEVMGVDAFAESAILIKARIKTIPVKQWMVGREMNRRIKKKFDEAGIEIPFPHRTLYLEGAKMPGASGGAGIDRQELKAALEELLAERREDKSSPSSGSEQPQTS
jgi:small conductance mechanosensitive channel